MWSEIYGEMAPFDVERKRLYGIRPVGGHCHMRAVSVPRHNYHRRVGATFAIAHDARSRCDEM